MTDLAIQSILAASPGDQNLVNILVMGIIAVIWLVATLSRSRKQVPNPETSEPEAEEEATWPHPSSGEPGGWDSPSQESSSPQPPEPERTHPEPATLRSPLGAGPESGQTEPILARLAAVVGGPMELQAPDIEVPETEHLTTGYSLGSLWTSSGPGLQADPYILEGLDPEELRRAVIVNELLAEPVSIRSVDHTAPMS